MVKTKVNKSNDKLKPRKCEKRGEKGAPKVTQSKLKNLVDSYKNKKATTSTGDERKDSKDDRKKLANKVVENGPAEAPEPKESPTRAQQAPESGSYDAKDSTLVFIGNVPLSIKTKSDLLKSLDLDPKIVQSVHFRSLPVDPKFAFNKKAAVIRKKFSDVKDNQNAYVKVTDPKYLDDILSKNTMEVDGHHLFINAGTSDAFSKFSRKKTVFVGRLPPSATEDDLYNVFMNISPVKAVRIVRDPMTMKSKVLFPFYAVQGFGFVAFDNRLAVSEAIREFNNTKFKGYTLNVTKCLDEEASKQGKHVFRKPRGKGPKTFFPKKKKK